MIEEILYRATLLGTTDVCMIETTQSSNIIIVILLIVRSYVCMNNYYFPKDLLPYKASCGVHVCMCVVCGSARVFITNLH